MLSIGNQANHECLYPNSFPVFYKAKDVNMYVPKLIKSGINKATPRVAIVAANAVSEDISFKSSVSVSSDS